MRLAVRRRQPVRELTTPAHVQSETCASASYASSTSWKTPSSLLLLESRWTSSLLSLRRSLLSSLLLSRSSVEEHDQHLNLSISSLPHCRGVLAYSWSHGPGLCRWLRNSLFYLRAHPQSLSFLQTNPLPYRFILSALTFPQPVVVFGRRRLPYLTAGQVIEG